MKTLTGQDLALIERVVAMTDREHQGIGFHQHPQQGQFVITAFQIAPSVERYVGFCVQVRKGSGQFRSDMVFLRHPSGKLVTHENQAFYRLTEEQEQLLRTVYDPDDLPEAEDDTQGYNCVNKVHETGFLIENSASPAAPVVPTRITVRGGTAGNDLLEDIVII